MPSTRLQHRDIGVGVDADLGSDLERAAYDLTRGEVGVLDKRSRGGQGIGSTGADCNYSVVGLDDIAGSGNDETVLAIGHGEQRFETSEDAVTPPVFRQLYRRALQIAGVALELLLEFLEERKCVGRGTSEAGEQLAPMQRADLLRIRLHYCLADGYLTVASKRDLTIAAHCEDRRRTDTLQFTLHRFKITPLLWVRWPGKGSGLLLFLQFNPS